jgi:hypothetical protein
LKDHDAIQTFRELKCLKSLELTQYIERGPTAYISAGLPVGIQEEEALFSFKAILKTFTDQAGTVLEEAKVVFCTTPLSAHMEQYTTFEAHKKFGGGYKSSKRLRL